MTWLPDHRATHGPDADCDACRPPEVASRAAAVRIPEAPAMAGVRPDLVIQPGTNRK